MVYCPPRSTSQNQHYNDYPPQTTQTPGCSSSHLYPPSNSNTSTHNLQHNSRGAYPPQPQKSIKRSYSPLPRPPIGPIPTSRAPSPTPLRPPSRAQTYPSVNLYTRGNNTPRGPEGRRKSRGYPEQKNRERSARKGVQDEEMKRDEERKKKAEEKWREEEAKNKREYDSGKEKLDYRRRMERDRNRPIDRREIGPSGAADRGFHRGGEQGNLGKRVSWKGQTFRGDPRVTLLRI
ncbi:hypothetical protein BCON_0226g00180 [Botryotinia convoluta]|uniref:Uncharacterized protein n=1 Tax=Botryotinia convoluta TaxID=54673 RepID=A0A4Z1HIM6_9HELO|nr:hypothetical protein BCON_0226g00180 [Botryotinia convoluta]